MYNRATTIANANVCFAIETTVIRLSYPIDLENSGFLLRFKNRHFATSDN